MVIGISASELAETSVYVRCQSCGWKEDQY